MKTELRGGEILELSGIVKEKAGCSRVIAEWWEVDSCRGCVLDNARDNEVCCEMPNCVGGIIFRAAGE